MDPIVINWLGPYSLNQTTPKELRGKKGLYATAHGSNIILIGKAMHGKGIFREAKEGRLSTYWEGLRKLKVVPEEKPSGYKLLEYVYENCSLYAGVARREDLNNIEVTEQLLVYRVKPIRNEEFVKSYEGPLGLSVINNGNPPPGIEHIILAPSSTKSAK